MRKSGEWMTIWDDRILEVIDADEDDIGRVGELANHEYIRISQSSVSRRCRKLADQGLLRRVGDGVYLLTEQGERYLAGEFDAHEDALEEEFEDQDGPGSAE